MTVTALIPAKEERLQGELSAFLQEKEQEEREAAHERAYQEARKRTAERIAATQELPKLQLDQDKDELKSLDRFFDDK